MRDPLLIDFQDEPIPERPPIGVTRHELEARYLNRDLKQLAADMLVAFDKQYKLRKNQDTLQANLLETQAKLKTAKRTIWFLSLIVGPIVTMVLKKILGY